MALDLAATLLDKRAGPGHDPLEVPLQDALERGTCGLPVAHGGANSAILARVTLEHYLGRPPLLRR